jgi:hypothetical protein
VTLVFFLESIYLSTGGDGGGGTTPLANEMSPALSLPFNLRPSDILTTGDRLQKAHIVLLLVFHNKSLSLMGKLIVAALHKCMLGGLNIEPLM